MLLAGTLVYPFLAPIVKATDAHVAPTIFPPPSAVTRQLTRSRGDVLWRVQMPSAALRSSPCSTTPRAARRFGPLIVFFFNLVVIRQISTCHTASLLPPISARINCFCRCKMPLPPSKLPTRPWTPLLLQFQWRRSSCGECPGCQSSRLLRMGCRCGRAVHCLVSPAFIALLQSKRAARVEQLLRQRGIYQCDATAARRLGGMSVELGDE